MSENRHTIRNLDPELITQARIHVLQTGRATLGELVSDAVTMLIEYETQEDDEVG